MKTSDDIDRLKAGVTARLDDDSRTIAALRAERDQARSDLAAERVASAEAAWALEVARKALEEVETAAKGVGLKRSGSDEGGWHESLCNMGDFDTVGPAEAGERFRSIEVIASRALRSMAGAASEPAAMIAVPLSMVEREFDCPTCETKAGSQCVSITDGNLRRGPHDHRVRLARVRSVARGMAGEK